MSSSKTVRKLEVVSPVPTDIDIANSVQPFHISEIANELNLNPKHYDLYGKYKAKVSKSSSLSMYVSLNKKKVLFFNGCWVLGKVSKSFSLSMYA